MKTNMLTRARHYYNSDLVSRVQNRHNQRAWIRSIRLLGDRWLLAAPLTRPDTPDAYSPGIVQTLWTPDPTRHSPTPVERLPDTSKRKLLITQCSDPLMWYAGKIGQTVPYIGHWPEGFKSREDAGHVNIVKFTDAVIVD
jgi:hypothetical protein